MKTTQRESNPYCHSDTNKRYQTFDYYMKRRFGGKIAKIPLDAGLSCPNIDGKCGFGGCIYCSGGSSGVGHDMRRASLEEQYALGVSSIGEKWTPVGYIPYLQAHTNTYAPPEVLRDIYKRAAALPGAVMLDVATRADCLDEASIGELVRISEKLPLTVELGLQTSDDITAELIGRGHSFDDFKRGYAALRAAGGDIKICIRLIAGLPGEDIGTMISSARDTAALKPDMVKLHLLHVIKGTRLYDMYSSGEYEPMKREDYINAACSMIEVMPRDCVIARLTGDGIASELAAPMWSIKKVSVINDIDKELYRRGTYQGIYEGRAE